MRHIGVGAQRTANHRVLRWYTDDMVFRVDMQRRHGVYKTILLHIHKRLEQTSVIGNSEYDVLLPVLQSFMQDAKTRQPIEYLRLMEKACECGGTTNTVCIGKTRRMGGKQSKHKTLETWLGCLVAKKTQFDDESKMESTEYARYNSQLVTQFNTFGNSAPRPAAPAPYRSTNN